MNDFSTVRELLVLQPATYVPIKQPLPNSLGDKSRTAVRHPLHPQSGLEWHSGRPTLECSCQYTVTLPPTTHHTHSHACRVPDSPWVWLCARLVGPLGKDAKVKLTREGIRNYYSCLALLTELNYAISLVSSIQVKGTRLGRKIMRSVQLKCSTKWEDKKKTDVLQQSECWSKQTKLSASAMT